VAFLFTEIFITKARVSELSDYLAIDKLVDAENAKLAQPCNSRGASANEKCGDSCY
jgi:hypothetical protein